MPNAVPAVPNNTAQQTAQPLLLQQPAPQQIAQPPMFQQPVPEQAIQQPALNQQEPVHEQPAVGIDAAAVMTQERSDEWDRNYAYYKQRGDWPVDQDAPAGAADPVAPVAQEPGGEEVMDFADCDQLMNELVSGAAQQQEVPLAQPDQEQQVVPVPEQQIPDVPEEMIDPALQQVVFQGVEHQTAGVEEMQVAQGHEQQFPQALEQQPAATPLVDFDLNQYIMGEPEQQAEGDNQGFQQNFFDPLDEQVGLGDFGNFDAAHLESPENLAEFMHVPELPVVGGEDVGDLVVEQQMGQQQAGEQQGQQPGEQQTGQEVGEQIGQPAQQQVPSSVGQPLDNHENQRQAQPMEYNFNQGYPVQQQQELQQQQLSGAEQDNGQHQSHMDQFVNLPAEDNNAQNNLPTAAANDHIDDQEDVDDDDEDDDDLFGDSFVEAHGQANGGVEATPNKRKRGDSAEPEGGQSARKPRME